MRILSPKVILTVVSLALVSLLVVLDLERTSPGPLSVAHGQVGGLSEDSCESCHGDSQTTLAQACNSCHTTIARQLATAGGFHGLLEQPTDCGACHLEHIGSELALVGDISFTRAGYDPRESYAHEGLSFALKGAHDALVCGDCHELADVEALAEGQLRFLGASQDCATCHTDPHEGRMLQGCAACHGQTQGFADLDGFVHGSTFELSGVHSSSNCADCHVPGSAYAVEALGGSDAPPARTCSDCHESPHSPLFIAGVAAIVDVQVGASCVVCHPTGGHPIDGQPVGDQGFDVFDLEATSRLHSASGFELAPPHQQVGCASCHSQVSDSPRLATDCAACHAGPHGAQFDEGPFEASECTACHAQTSFLPATFTAAMHAQTSFPLTASHADASCTDCHRLEPGRALGHSDLGVLSGACSDCHADAHAGLPVWTRSASGPTEDCDACHTTTQFDDVAADSFDHTTRTGFELTGAHATADCDSCHQRSSKADALGRRFGKINELFGEPTTACATCHDNVHVGAMTTTSTDCANCHTTSDFAHVDRLAFDHGAITGFGLTGAHARAGCESCHVPRRTPDAGGRSFGLASETFGRGTDNCASCHAGPHGSRFDSLVEPTNTIGGRGSSTGGEGCIRCHDQESFSMNARADFDHVGWTGFPLEGGHASLSCEDCHVLPGQYALGRTRGENCSACHGDTHFGQFGVRDARGCERCHQSTSAFDELSFDHQTDSRFRLDGEHNNLACSACHQPWKLSGGGEAIRYRPLGTECSDCHLGGDKR